MITDAEKQTELSPKLVKLKVYKNIPDAKNIISSLVKNINDNEKYQKHITKLEKSDKSSDNKKALTIKNTIKNIKIYGTKSKPLFLARDIGILLGTSHICIMAKKYDNEEKIIGYTTTNQSKQVMFLTQHGFYRTFFLSRSPLAKLFRTFIYELIDHVIKHEPKTIKKIATKILNKKPDVIKQGMVDLEQKLNLIEHQLLLKTQESDKWEKTAKEENQLRKDAEQDRDYIDIDNSYNQMQIKQLRQEKEIYVARLSDSLLESITDDQKELYMIKKKYMKPVQLYIISPEYLKKNKSRARIIIQESQILPVEDDSDIEEEIKSHTKKIKEKSTRDTKNTNLTNKDIMITDIDIDDYSKIYKTIKDLHDTNILNGDSESSMISLASDELLYFYTSFSKNISTKHELLHVGVEWVMNKQHYDDSIADLYRLCKCFEITKNNQITYTSYNDIKEIIQKKIIT